MKRALKVIIPVILVLCIIASLVWYLMIYDPGFTKDFLLKQARGFESVGEHDIAEWIYGLAYNQAHGGDEVAIELAQYYIDNGNYTKAEYTLSNAIADKPSVNLYVALCRTYVEQDKLLDAVTMLNNIADPAMKAELDSRRPAAPVASPAPNFYSQYIDVTVTAESGTLYMSNNGEYPTTEFAASGDSITLPGGVTTLMALSVSDDLLVSPLAIFGYTVGGVIEPVSFTDPAMEEHIRTLLNVGSRTIYSDELWEITELTVPEDTKVFDDLVHFQNLEKLLISDCGRADLTPISSLKKLKSLSISKGSITREGLVSIGSLHNLEQLTLTNCGLTSIANLSELKNLTHLNLSYNTLRNIDIFAGMGGLQELRMAGNALTDLSAISGLNEIIYLDVSHNSLQSLAPVCSLANLKTLMANNNSITSIEGFESLQNLQILNLNQNLITDISMIYACTKLSELDASNNMIEDISGLSANTNLIRLLMSHNAIIELPVFEKTCALATLDISHNLLTDIEELKDLKNLNTINIDYNEEVEDLMPLATNYALIKVSCYGTKVSEVTFLTDRAIVVNYNPSEAFD